MSVNDEFKHVVVFGANSRMARHWLREMPYAKAKILLVSRDDSALQDLAQDIRSRKGYEMSLLAGDLTDALFQDQCLTKVQEDFSHLDHVLVAYGVLGDQGALEKNPEAAWDMIDLNFSSKARLLLSLIDKSILRAGSSITVISSVAGDRGRRSNYVYGSSYAALSAFVEGFAARLLSEKIFVQLIKPGFVDTPMTKDINKNFLFVSADKIARDIWSAYQRRCYISYTPWFWYWIMFMIRAIPGKIFRKMNYVTTFPFQLNRTLKPLLKNYMFRHFLYFLK